MQRQYCLRHYTNADVNLVPFLTSLDFRGPKVGTQANTHEREA